MFAGDRKAPIVRHSKGSRKRPPISIPEDELEKLRRTVRKQRERIKQLEDELFEITVLVPPVAGEVDGQRKNGQLG